MEVYMLSVVFTGPAVVNGERVTRKLLVDLASDAGMYIQNAVSRSTDYVVASSPDFKGRQGKKLKEAYNLGIPVISPVDFMKIVTDSNDWR